MTSGRRTLSRRLAPHPASVGEGRRFIRDVLTGSGSEHLSETAELLVSEVVTNALVHAGTEVWLVARVGRAGVRVEVSDGSPHLPTTKHYSSLTATGRGLHLLEQLVDHWGVDPHDHGKTVWFELGIQEQAPTGGHELMAESPGSGGDRSAGSIAVELLNVPLLLHAAWQMQAESLLREHLLSQLGDDNGTDQIERHAAASEALALLSEQVPSPALEDAPDALMATAVEPWVSAERVLVTVPGTSVPHFGLLHEILAAATGMADTGALLTPPTQPEVQALRRWLCTEVQQQTEGNRPEPWVGAVDAAAPRAAAEWDVTLVAEATTAMLAADDTNRILAVSASALTLLGYEEPSELVLRRLVEIIPSRYRQAHLAGFTLHLFAGRSPLLKAPVTVPALRRDGSEVMIGLTVRAHHLPEGRRVFIADLTASGPDDQASSPPPRHSWMEGDEDRSAV